MSNLNISIQIYEPSSGVRYCNCAYLSLDYFSYSDECNVMYSDYSIKLSDVKYTSEHYYASSWIPILCEIVVHDLVVKLQFQRFFLDVQVGLHFLYEQVMCLSPPGSKLSQCVQCNQKHDANYVIHTHTHAFRNTCHGVHE